MISQANSLTGTKVNDYVGNGGVTALSDGSYAVMSTVWNNESVQGVGALTWMRGGAKGVAIVSTNNSFIGTEEHPCNILIVVPLANANFVVQCIAFGSRNGSVTLGSGTDGLSGTASPTRSLMVSGTLVVALSDGNYAVASTESVAGTTKIGSVTWGDGDTGTVGNISAANSFFLSDAGDYIDGLDLKPVGNGNYVVANPFKDVDGRFNAGSVTWLKSGSPSTGTASSANSLVGSSSNDRIGADRIDTFANGDYVVSSPFYDRRPLINSGAHTLARGNGPIVGVIDDTNSVRGFSAAFASTHFAYDAVRDLFVVGQPRADLFSIFQLDSLFSNGF